MELNSEQELKKLLEEGRITDAEYKQLLEAVRKNQPAPSKEQSQGGRKGPRAFSFADVPWQIWIVAVMLTLEGIGDLFTIPSYPPAAIWVLAKIVFIVGLMRRWRVVFILFQIIAGIHVLYFAAAGGVDCFYPECSHDGPGVYSEGLLLPLKQRSFTNGG